MQIDYRPHPHAWRHSKWNKIQLWYFNEQCKIRREKNIEDLILTNGFTKIHLIKDNSILEEFLDENQIQLTSPDQADCVIITHQQFSRQDPENLLQMLNALFDQCPIIYFCINKYYLNSNEGIVCPDLVDNYDAAIVQWLTRNIYDSRVINLTEIFVEDGSCFTWVVPSSEILICKK